MSLRVRWAVLVPSCALCAPLSVPVCPGPSSREDAAAPPLPSPCLPGPWGQSPCGGETQPWPATLSHQLLRLELSLRGSGSPCLPGLDYPVPSGCGGPCVLSVSLGAGARDGAGSAALVRLLP